jgi:hypothetical protein
MTSVTHLVASTVRAVAGFGLCEEEASQGPASRDDTQSILRRIVDERLTGLALAAQSAGVLDLQDGEQRELVQHHANAMLWALALERELVFVTALFEEAGIGSVVLKGPAVAHTVYPDPAWRSFGDLDLLVEASDLARAVELLRAEGFERRLPEPRAGFDARFGKGVELRNASRIDVDLHRTLALGSFGVWLDTRALFERTEAFALGGRTFRKLDAEALLAHAALHATLGSRSPRLVALRDIAQISNSASPDWSEVERLSRSWHAQVVIAAALEGASAQLGWRIPPEAEPLLNRRASRREHRALAAYSRGSQRSDALALGSLRTIKGIRAKAAYARAMLLPSREFLAARASDRTEASYLRRWLSPLRRLFGQP